MTFFKVLGRALKQWLFFWDIYKIPNKGIRLRAVIGFMVFNAMWVWGLIFYYGGYLPYQDVKYPQLHETHINFGTLEQRKKGGYLLRTDNQNAIYLEYTHIYDLFEDRFKTLGTSEVPKLFVKVWWFPMTNISKGWIAQVEKDGEVVVSYEEQKKEFIRMADPSFFLIIMKAVFTLFLILFLWELLSQYIKYKQESN